MPKFLLHAALGLLANLATPASMGAAAFDSQLIVKSSRSERQLGGPYAGHAYDHELYLQITPRGKWRFDGKYLGQQRTQSGQVHQIDLLEARAHRRLDFLRLGLLPPYFERLVRRVLKRVPIARHRSTQYLLTAGHHRVQLSRGGVTRDSPYHGHGLVFDDRLDVGAFSIYQELSVQRRHLPDQLWLNQDYKIEFGWRRRFWLGQETLFFHAPQTGAATLRHWRYLRWQEHRNRVTVTLAQGQARGVFKGQIETSWRLALGYRF